MEELTRYFMLELFAKLTGQEREMVIALIVSILSSR